MQAMVELMRRKRYDAITVHEITDQANIGRSTFYAHFADKDDLLVDGVRQMLADLDADTPQPSGQGRPFYPTLALFHHVGTQTDMYQVMARGRGLTLFLAALQDQLTAVITDRLATRVQPGDTPAVPPPFLAAMIAGMLITAIRTWIDNGATTPAETVDRMFHAAAGPAIRAGLRPPRG